MNNDVCDICGQPLAGGVDKGNGKVYHWQCVYDAPDMVETRKIAQSAVPHKVKKDVSND
jgi:hypothetical protein